MYIEGNNQTGGPIRNYAQEPTNNLEGVLIWISLSNSTVGESAPM